MISKEADLRIRRVHEGRAEMDGVSGDGEAVTGDGLGCRNRCWRITRRERGVTKDVTHEHYFDCSN